MQKKYNADKDYKKAPVSNKSEILNRYTSQSNNKIILNEDEELFKDNTVEKSFDDKLSLTIIDW